MPSKKLKRLISKSSPGQVDDLSTDAQTLFGLLVLIVDIKYRNKYGRSIEHKDEIGYKMTISKGDEVSE